jgi:hypothetical protein
VGNHSHCKQLCNVSGTEQNKCADLIVCSCRKTTIICGFNRLYKLVRILTVGVLTVFEYFWSGFRDMCEIYDVIAERKNILDSCRYENKLTLSLFDLYSSPSVSISLVTSVKSLS